MKPGQENGSVILETIQESEAIVDALLDFSFGIKAALLANKIDRRDGIIAPIELTVEESHLTSSALRAAYLHPQTPTDTKQRISMMLAGLAKYLNT